MPALDTRRLLGGVKRRHTHILYYFEVCCCHLVLNLDFLRVTEEDSELKMRKDVFLNPDFALYFPLAFTGAAELPPAPGAVQPPWELSVLRSRKQADEKQVHSFARPSCVWLLHLWVSAGNSSCCCALSALNSVLLSAHVAAVSPCLFKILSCSECRFSLKSSRQAIWIFNKVSLWIIEFTNLDPASLLPRAQIWIWMYCIFRANKLPFIMLFVAGNKTVVGMNKLIFQNSPVSELEFIFPFLKIAVNMERVQTQEEWCGSVERLRVLRGSTSTAFIPLFVMT